MLSMIFVSVESLEKTMFVMICEDVCVIDWAGDGSYEEKDAVMGGYDKLRVEKGTSIWLVGSDGYRKGNCALRCCIYFS